MRAPSLRQGIPKFRLADRLEQAGENPGFFQTSRPLRTPHRGQHDERGGPQFRVGFDRLRQHFSIHARHLVVENGNVVRIAGGPGLAQQTLACARPQLGKRQHQLERHRNIERQVMRLPHRAHAPDAQQMQQPAPTDHATGEAGIRGMKITVSQCDELLQTMGSVLNPLFAPQDLDTLFANQVRQAGDAAEAELAVETRGQPVLAVRRDIQPTTPGKGLARDSLDQGSAHALASGLRPYREQGDERAEQEVGLKHQDSQDRALLDGRQHAAGTRAPK